MDFQHQQHLETINTNLINTKEKLDLYNTIFGDDKKVQQARRYIENGIKQDLEELARRSEMFKVALNTIINDKDIKNILSYDKLNLLYDKFNVKVGELEIE